MGEEAATMAPGEITVTYADALALLAAAFILLWLRLSGRSPWQLCAGAALTASGYLRRRPDPATETRVRTALAGLDRDLNAGLGQHVGCRLTASPAGDCSQVRRLPRPAGSCRGTPATRG